MRLKGLDINLLVALDALLTERNITRAGERIGLTQSGMSGALARLRDFFKDDLIVATGRELVLTPLAEALIEPVRRVLVRIDSTIVTRPDFDPATDKRSYRLLVSEHALMLLVPAVVERLTHEAPEVVLNFSLMRGDAVELLERGDIDLMILPAGFHSPDHSHQEIMQETYHCIAWRENPLVGKTISLDQYQQLGHVVAQQWPSGAPMHEGRYLEGIGIRRRAELTTSSMIAPPLLVVGTPLIATVHSRLLGTIAAPDALRILPTPIPIPPLSLGMQWHHLKSDDQGLAWLRNIIQEEASRI